MAASDAVFEMEAFFLQMGELGFLDSSFFLDHLRISGLLPVEGGTQGWRVRLMVSMVPLSAESFIFWPELS